MQHSWLVDVLDVLAAYHSLTKMISVVTAVLIMVTWLSTSKLTLERSSTSAVLVAHAMPLIYAVTRKRVFIALNHPIFCGSK